MVKKLVMGLILALIPFLLLELGLRILGIGGSVLYEEHPEYGYRPAPDQTFSTLGKPIRINDRGYRGPVDDSPILCIGDSVTYGTAAVADDETFPARLGALNAGVNGWGIPNVAAYLQHAPLDGIETVVWLIPSCDVLRPFMTLRDGLISTNRRMLFRTEYLFRFIWYGHIMPEPSPNPFDQFEPNLAAVKATAGHLDERDIRLLLVFLPYREEAMGETVRETPYVQKMIEACRDAGLNPIVLQPDGDPAALYRDSAHLTPEGNRWLARQLNPLLEKTTP